jgi:hypothetical protein
MLTRLCFGTHTVAEFMDPDWGEKVNVSIGLSYWPAGLCAGRPVRQLYVGVNFIPQSEIYEFGYCCTSIFVD